MRIAIQLASVAGEVIVLLGMARCALLINFFYSFIVMTQMIVYQNGVLMRRKWGVLLKGTSIISDGNGSLLCALAFISPIAQKYCSLVTLQFC